MPEALVRPTLTHVAKALGVPLPTLSGIIQQGHISSIPKKPGPGVGKHQLTATQILETIIYNELRRLSADGKLISQRAKALTLAAAPALLGAVRGEHPEGPGYLLLVIGDREEERLFLPNLEKLEERWRAAVFEGKLAIPLRLKVVFKQLFRIFTTAESHPFEDASIDDTPKREVTDAKGESGVFSVRRLGSHSGIVTGREGLEILHRGEGLRIELSADHWRELGRRAEAIADELEGRPRNDLAGRWALKAEVAGNA